MAARHKIRTVFFRGIMAEAVAYPKQQTLTGIGLVLVSVFLFAIQDAITKELTADYTFAEILFFRGVGSLLILAPLWLRLSKDLKWTGQPPILFLRCLSGTLGMICFIFAFELLPLADATAVGFAGPLFVVILAALILKEHVGWRRWLAIGVGFCGVLIILRPGSGVLSVGALWALGGAFSFGFIALSLRLLGRTDHPVSITFYYTLFSMALMVPVIAYLGLSPLTLASFGLMMTQGLACGGGQILMTQALKLAPASVVTPFSYVMLLYTTVIGYLWFGDIPDQYVFAGSALLIGAGLYIWFRERQLNLESADTEAAGAER